jgi:hypothetical protein
MTLHYFGAHHPATMIERIETALRNVWSQALAA